MFCFAIGFVLGVVTVLAPAASLIWWLLRGANRPAAAKLLEGFALVLASKPKAPPVAWPPLGEPAEVSAVTNASGNTQGVGGSVGAKAVEVDTARNWLLLEANKANNSNKHQSPSDARKPGKTNGGKIEDRGHEQ